MIILLRVAGIAIGGCAFEDVIDMTVQAGDRGVLTRQFEGGQVVVVDGRFPSSGGVAGITGGAKGTLVIILRCVAGIAAGGCAL